MKGTWLESQDWLSVAAIPGILVLFVEALMAYELVIRLRSYSLTSVNYGNHIYFYISINIILMILIPWSLFRAVLEYQSIEKRMRRLGAEGDDIDSLQKNMRSILTSSYELLFMIVVVISIHLPQK
jgi:hypothetical protein